MAGSTFPFKWSTGVRPLRADLWAMIQLPGRTVEELGYRNPQLAALEAGQDVTFTTAQLVSFYPNGQASHPDVPADLNAHAFWTLTGDSTLRPYHLKKNIARGRP